jgi:perosamine synthetase
MSTVASNFLPYYRASIEEDEIDAVLKVLQSGWLTTGPRTREFEASFARFIGCSHALALSSCTAALHLALAAVGVTEGDEVILPTMTFASSGEVVLYFKARPVLVDCQEKSFHLDSEQVARLVTSRTRAIMPVHYSGCACDMDLILEIARRHKLKVIDDAAHALPSTYKGRIIGTLGDITCFSFYATKPITTGEGGMATTETHEYDERMRLLSQHGITNNTWNRYSGEVSWRYDILEAGYKYNLTDLQSALGLAQLAKCYALRERRASIAQRYTEALKSIDAFEAPRIPQNIEHAWHMYVIQVNSSALRINRDRVIEELKLRGIGTSVHFIPLHLHPLYQRLGYRTGQFPHAEKHYQRAISIPIFPSMTNEDSARVINALQEISRRYRR